MTSTLDRIADLGIVPVATIDDVEAGRSVADALTAGGLPCIEVTLRTDAGLAVIDAVASARSDLLVGAGTVLSVEQAASAVDAGARFVASPAFDPDVVAWCLERDVFVLPGVATPTEMNRARQAGLGAVKFFPAGPSGGPAAIAAAAAVYPDLRFVPTGGIGPDDAAGYLRIAAVAAVGGSWMVPRDLVGRRDTTAITRLAEDAVRLAVETRRGGS